MEAMDDWSVDKVLEELGPGSVLGEIRSVAVPCRTYTTSTRIDPTVIATGTTSSWSEEAGWGRMLHSYACFISGCWFNPRISSMLNGVKEVGRGAPEVFASRCCRSGRSSSASTRSRRLSILKN